MANINGCESVTTENSSTVGYTAKLHEALETINCINIRGLKFLLRELVEADIFDGGLINKTIAAVEKARRILAAMEKEEGCDGMK